MNNAESRGMALAEPSAPLDDPERLTEPMDPDDPEGTSVDPLPLPGDLGIERPSDRPMAVTVPLESPQPVGISEAGNEAGDTAISDFVDPDSPLGEDPIPL